MGKLSEEEFAAIVKGVAAGMSEVLSASTSGFNVLAKIKSNSGKSKWDANLNFDKLTGDVAGHFPYLAAKAPRWFAEAVQEQIRKKLAE